MKDSNTELRIAYTAVKFFLIFGLSIQSLSAAERPFYEGKTVTIIAGFASGGTIDMRARLFARHLSKYIAGNPSIVVQNQVGAGGLVAANHVFSVAKPDGLRCYTFRQAR
ncbi:MAG: hypothetical protein GEU77_19050 [Deltaproteobacteria bacterium]|nr:hypothetical protein [Deltaproteobacteria bacterium]